MKILPNLFGFQLIAIVVTLCLQQHSVSAQSITPANDGTGTQINTNGNRYDIEGGSVSQDGENLFHSFEKFGLDNGEIANFLSNPDIRNILGRVVGGDASIIQGLIQITGGNSNLFLINPAGVIFGANASLNIPADFTVTTATGIQFGQNWFNAVGSNNYSSLIGTPSGYNFAVSQPGVILNEANLTLSEGSHLTFLGGTVINTGELSSPGGQITIAAVEGENFVRISQEGQLLNLEITPIEVNDNSNYPITPLSLPQLLTGGESDSNANTVIVSNGEVILKNSDTIIPEQPGTTIAAGRFDVSDNNTGGTVNIFSRNSAIIESEINTIGENIAGNIFINSDNNITINQLTAETENLEFIAAEDININQINTEGYLTAETQEGNINPIGENSLITASSVLFQTGETGNIGTVNNPLLLNVENLEAVGGSGGIFLETNSPLTIGNVSEEFTGLSTTGGGEIHLNVEGKLTVSEDISTAVTDDTNAGNITLNSSGDINFIAGSLNSSSGEAVYDEDGSLISNIGGDGGNITLISEGNITTEAYDLITNGMNSSSNGTGRGGDITIESNTGEIDTSFYRLNSSSSLGDGGNINLISEGNITTTGMNSSSLGTGNGGDITLNSNTGDINSFGNSFLSVLDSHSNSGNAGNVSLIANGNITTSEIDSSSQGTGNGGDITLSSNTGEINSIVDPSYSVIDSFSNDGDGGNILIEAMDRIRIPTVNASGGQNGGDVNIISQDSNINTGEINYSGESGTSGNLNIQAYSGSIELGEFSSRNLTITDGGEDNPLTNNNPDANLNSDANLINNQANEVILEAHNDITLNQSIESDSISHLELKAGRNININADIDLNANNGDITLRANTGGANPDYRESGSGNIIMQPDTILNAGEGDIQLFLGSFGEAENIGDITIANLQTTGNVTVEANGGNIISAANDSLITANSVVLYTQNNGGIGSEINPINLNINTLEGNTGSGGAFFHSPNQGITITEFKSLYSGDVVITATENITVTDNITASNINNSATNTSGSITLESTNGEINTVGSLLDSSTAPDDTVGGDITLTAEGNIISGEIFSWSHSGISGEITVTSKTGEIDSTSGWFGLGSASYFGQAGNVTLNAPGNITTSDVYSFAYDNAYGNAVAGDLTLNSTNGEINTTQGTLTSFSNGDTGNITLTAKGNVTTGYIDSSSYSEGRSGNVSITSQQGSIDTTAAVQANQSLSTDSSFEEIIDTFQWKDYGYDQSFLIRDYKVNIDTTSNGTGGNVTLEALGDITVFDIITRGGVNGGSVEISSQQGNINTGILFSVAETENGGNIALNSPQGKTTTSYLLSLSNEGIAGNVSLDAAGHIETQGISSNGLQQGGNITINSDSQNSIEILGDLNSFSEAGIAGDINLSSPGNITIQNVNSFGQEQSGNLTIESQGDISTQSITTQADNGLSGNIIVNGNNVASGNIASIGTESAGKIEIEATDGTVETVDITSSSSEGNAGGIEVVATEDIKTGDQTVESDEGDARITNEAGNDIETDNQTTEANNGDSAIENTGNNVNVDNQTARTEAGNASVSNTADSDINANNQTATTENGNASVNNTAENDINTNNQTAVTEEGNANISNEAGNDINVNNQTAITEEGNATVSNTAESDINVNNQTAITESGNANISNEAGNDINVNSQTAITEEGTATIENNAGGEINVDNQTATENGNPGTIINEAGNSNLDNQIQENNPNNPESISNSDLTNPPDNSTPVLVLSETESISSSQESATTNRLQMNQYQTNRLNTIATETQTSAEVDSDNLNLDSDDINRLNLATISPLSIVDADAVTNLESSRNQEFADYFGEDLAENNLTTENVRTVLNDIAEKTGNHSAVVYVTLEINQLELVVFTVDSQPLSYQVEVPQEELLKVARTFHHEVANPRMSQRYLKPAQQLYDWLMRPIEAHLQAAGIDTIVFSLDAGLRGLPIAAIHDGEQFLIEKYSFSLIPSISLINTHYQTLTNTEVLAMGASEFKQHEPLPGVPVELELITQRRWPGEQFLNQEFTRENLINQRKNNSYSIIHLATHSDFSKQSPDESYIQLWQDEQLKLNQLRTSLLADTPLELLVLSSCQTAVGDEKAEMGFAGLAVQAKVKTALASLWYVDDMGTLALMSEFYRHLDGIEMKASALRKAQLAMIEGRVEDIETQLYASESLDEIALPTQTRSLSDLDLSHPYYWSAFTMVGSPW
jgi:filamentous hemagglutinin family protein